MRAKVLALASTLLLASCHGDAKDAVRMQLIDPDSANFEDLSRAGKGTVVCGFVNAKNRLGGYTGWTAFIYDGQRAYLIENSLSKGSSLFIKKCTSTQTSRYISLRANETGNDAY